MTGRGKPGVPAGTRGPIRVATDAILESISDGVFTVDRDWLVRSFNRAAELITGIPCEEALGRRCSDVFRASMCESECALKHTMESGAAVVNKATFIVTSSGKRLPISVSTALLRDEHGAVVGGAETFRDLSLIEELRSQAKGRFQVGDIVSRSASMRRLLEVLPRIADSESTILLQGETGTGKELMARATHGLSGRRDGPFVAVNCGAHPDTLLESELCFRDGAGASAMRAALTVWDGRVAPVFDVSREALVLTIEDGAITSRSLEDLETPMASLKLERLTELGVQTLVCGAITEPLQHELSVRGVTVIGFVAGEIDVVVESLLAGTLPTRALSMPGCGSRQHRFRGGRGRGGWRGGGCGRKGRP